jgi:hypothetical protein
LVLKEPGAAAKLKTNFMRNNIRYNRIFDPKLDIRIYPVIINIVKAIEHSLNERRSAWGQLQAKFPAEYRCLFSAAWVARRLGGNKYEPNALLTLPEPTIDTTEMDDIWSKICMIAKDGNFKSRRLFKNQVIIRGVLGI